MPTYYFNLFDDVISLDPEGRSLTNDAVALQEGIKSARIMAADSVSRGKLNLDHRIEVRDDHHRAVGAIHFRDVVKIETHK